jgi:hypothetical protein
MMHVFMARGSRTVDIITKGAELTYLHVPVQTTCILIKSKFSGVYYILAPPERAPISQQKSSASGLISILKYL